MSEIVYKRSVRARRMRIAVQPDLTVRVTVPRGVSLESARRFVSEQQDWIEKHLDRFRQLRREANWPDLDTIDLDRAQADLFDRLEAFSRQHNLPYNRATFRKQRTIWGSCSARNNISLNINLVFLPRHLQDYVLLHELVHTRHRHHGPSFWAALDRVTNNRARALEKELSRQLLRF